MKEERGPVASSRRAPLGLILPLSLPHFAWDDDWRMERNGKTIWGFDVFFPFSLETTILFIREITRK